MYQGHDDVGAVGHDMWWQPGDGDEQGLLPAGGAGPATPGLQFRGESRGLSRGHFSSHHDSNKNAPKCAQWVWGIDWRKQIFFVRAKTVFGARFGAFLAFGYYLDRDFLMFFRYGFSDVF